MTPSTPAAATTPVTAAATTEASSPPDSPKLSPLTEPAELMALLGRFMACGVLFILTITAFVMRSFVVGMGVGLFSLFYQRSTLKMWRRMRDERMALEAERSGVAVAEEAVAR